MQSSVWLEGVNEFVLLMLINPFRILPGRPGAGVADLVL
jgi:hypothetical protein